MSTPPVAKRVPTTREHHGDVVTDPYEWLRAKEDPEVLAHLEAENAYTEDQLSSLEPLRTRIFDEISSRIQQTDLSVPLREGAWWYYTRSVEGKQYGISCRAPIADAEDWDPPVLEPGTPVEGEQVLLDSNVEAEGHDFFSLGTFDVSADGRLLAYATDVVGDERYTLRIRDLETGVDRPDEVRGTAPGAVLSPDGAHVFYTTVDESWRPDTVWRHSIGGDSEDVVVFREPDERFWVGIGISRSRRYLTLELDSKITSEVWLLPADDPTGEFRVVWPRREGVEYSVSHAVLGGDDRLLILHNDGATNFELVSVAAADPQGPREVVLPADPETRLEGVSSFAGHVAVAFRRRGLARVGLLALPGLTAPDSENPGPLRELPFDEPLFTAHLAGNPEWDQPTLRLGYGSFVTPATVFDYDVESGALRLRKRQPVLGGYDPTDYEQRRVWAPAADGALVPVSLVARREVFDRPPTAGPPPVLLYGYGSYEASMDPSFSPRGCPFSTAACSTPSRTCAAAASSAGSGTSRAGC
ncbi:hypothetical protein GCM10025866_35770 [Naasia aerilata]|uniref:Peptidase S9A N-terminal domain-containing protein n=1 Tax=Naasia aerilata TaxID=1162966 RepID=A0ABN6XRX2_9MICO|nr:hypothetical protein GCM10025866_35770 [Naasia aerilata]